jgi:uncharacterized protein with PQ loop repeat
MPELLTKHPKIVKSMLEDMGAKCGQGKPQKILKKCPEDSFCAVKSGEFCVLGLDQADKLTQFKVPKLKESFLGFQQNPSIKHSWTGDVAILIIMISFMPILCEIIKERSVYHFPTAHLVLQLIAAGFWLYFGYVNELMPNMISALFFIIFFIILLVLKFVFRRKGK